jgi:hypothetical protein
VGGEAKAPHSAAASTKGHFCPLDTIPVFRRWTKPSACNAIGNRFAQTAAHEHVIPDVLKMLGFLNTLAGGSTL